MKALLIDPFLQDIAKVDIPDTLQGLYKAIDCTCITAIRPAEDEALYLDDEGLYRPDQRYFIWEGYPQPLAGRGLICGITEDGSNADTEMTLEQARKAVTWADLEFTHTTSEESTVEVYGSPMTRIAVKAHFKPRREKQ